MCPNSEWFIGLKRLISLTSGASAKVNQVSYSWKLAQLMYYDLVSLSCDLN